MSWQEPIVAIIVGLAVVSLYRHMRELIGSAAPDAQGTCHGCDDCASESDTAPPHQAENDPLLPQSTQIH